MDKFKYQLFLETTNKSIQFLRLLLLLVHHQGRPHLRTHRELGQRTESMGFIRHLLLHVRVHQTSHRCNRRSVDRIKTVTVAALLCDKGYFGGHRRGKGLHIVENSTWNNLLGKFTAKRADRTYSGFDSSHFSSNIFRSSACLCSNLGSIDLGVWTRGT